MLHNGYYVRGKVKEKESTARVMLLDESFFESVDTNDIVQVSFRLTLLSSRL